MDIRFDLDADTLQPHITGHGVTAAEQVIRNAGDDTPGANDTRIKLGRTDAGRYLQVVDVTDDDGLGLFVITAYELQGKAKRAFRRRRRGRGQ